MSKPKREDIQGLRAVAIIMVLLFHFFPNDFPNGYVGVDMFFVISGYIISMVFPKELSFEKIVDFYYRRVKRILPLYFTVILSVLIATVFFAPQNFVEVNMTSGQRAVLWISNIMSATTAELDYKRLIDNAEDLFTHCWSICLEMQWYLLAPLVFFFKSGYRVLFCQAVLMISTFHYITADESTQFNCVFARLWQFLSGILAHEFPEKVALEDDDTLPLMCSKQKGEDDILAVISQLLVLSMILGFLPIKHHPTVLRGVMTASTAALLLTGAVIKEPFLSSSVFSWIGNVSYSLYLVHWPIYIIAKQNGRTTDLCLGLAISVAVAALVYYFFEQSYLLWEKLTILIFVSGVFTAALFLSMKGSEISNKLRAKPTAEEIVEKNNTEMPWLATNIAAGGLPNSTNNLNSPLCIKYERMFGVPEDAPMGHCKMPNGNGSYNMLVLGNSWATNQGEMVYKAFGKYAKTFDVFSRAGCEPLYQADWCKRVRNYGRLAVEHFKPDVLFILQRVISTTEKMNSTNIDDDPFFAAELDNLRYYEKFAKKIYIQQALPSCTQACTTAAVNEMMEKKQNLTEIGDKFIQRDEEYARIRISELAKRCKNCELIDFLPRYPTGPNGKPTFYDLERNLVLLDNEMHLNKFGKEKMQPVFDDLAKTFKL